MKRSLLILIFGILLTSNSYAIEPLFDTRIDYPVNDSANFVYCAELNGDNSIDMVVVPSNSDSILIFINRGDGTFFPPTKFLVGPRMKSAYASDLDNDGSSDLAIINNSTGSRLHIFWNNGFGEFEAGPTFSFESTSWLSAVHCADLNGDNHNDILATDFVLGRVYVFLYDGYRHFAHYVIYYPGSEPASVVAFDLDNDGDKDIATANQGAGQYGISILKNDGNGIFGPDTLYRYNNSTNFIRAADFNNDGFMDLTCIADTGVVVMLNDGNGVFASRSMIGGSIGMRAVYPSDLNGDNFIDLAAVNYNRSTMTTYSNNGDGTFTNIAIYSAGDQPRSVFCADLDEDGANDIAVSNQDGKSVSIYKNKGDGTFFNPSLLDIAYLPVQIICPDIDGNGFSDIVALGPLATTSIYLSNGSGFSEPINLDRDFPADGINSADFNRDGFTDLAIWTNEFNQFLEIRILNGNGDGSFQSPHLLYVESPIQFNSLSCFDLNRDSYDDLIIGGDYDTIWVKFNDGTGDFGNSIPIALDEQDTRALAIGDINNDGISDIVTGYIGKFTIIENNGDGTFGDITSYTDTTNFNSILVIDFDQDDTLDIVLAGNHYLSLWHQVGDGGFENSSVISISSTMYGTGFWNADIDGDGISDILHFSNPGNLLNIYAKQGELQFQPTFGYGIGGRANSGASGDFDGNGTADVAASVVFQYNPQIAVLYNRRIPTGINDDEFIPLPVKSVLSQNFPNPFNAQTTIKYSLPIASHVTIDIFDILGRKISTLAQGRQLAGSHAVIWDASGTASGIYFYRIDANGYKETRQMVLLK